LTDNLAKWIITVEKLLTIGVVMDGFNAIPVFVAVVECGGFSPAARKLGV